MDSYIGDALAFDPNIAWMLVQAGDEFLSVADWHLRFLRFWVSSIARLINCANQSSLAQTKASTHFCLLPRPPWPVRSAEAAEAAQACTAGRRAAPMQLSKA